MATDRLLCVPPCVCTAFYVYRLACGPLNNMTPAVATDRLLCVPPCVCTAFYVYRLACGPLNNMTPAVATDPRGGDGLNRTFGRPYLRPAESAGRKSGRTFGRPIRRPKVRRADKSTEPIGHPNPSPAKSGGPTATSRWSPPCTIVAPPRWPAGGGARDLTTQPLRLNRVAPQIAC